MDVYEELFERDQQISKLLQQNCDIVTQNQILQNTINTLVCVKCKRGESNVHLNIELHDCLKLNKRNITIDRIDEMYAFVKKPREIVVQMALNLLIGDDKNTVPCVLLNSQTVLYKRFGVYNASNIDSFSMLVHDSIQDQLTSLTAVVMNDDITNVSVVIEVLNTFIQQRSFIECFRKALKKYSVI
jgi:hypothetical protein